MTRPVTPQAAAEASVHWVRLTMQADTASEGEERVAVLHVYSPVGESFYDETVSARQVAERVSALDVDRIDVFINSPGGAAWDGLAIMNALRRHRAPVHVTVDGLAASAASVIAMAGDRVTMARGSELMIHDASGMAWGDAATLRQTADVLDKLSDSYADSYAARAGGTRALWRTRMRQETWYTAEEAVQAGLADAWEDPGPGDDPQALAASALMAGGLTCRYQGRAHAPAPDVSRLPASEPGDQTTTHRKDTVMKDDVLAEGLRQRLGMADADADSLLSALDERLSAAEAAGAAPAVPEGVALVDAQALAQLKADAAAGREAAAALRKARVQSMVDEAVSQGRIAPAARATWVAAAERDEEGTRALLASMAANTVPVAEVGFGAGGDEVMSADERLYAEAWGEKAEVL